MTGVKRPFLLICGPRGVGKSSVGFQVFLEVMGSGIKVGYVDLDQVSFCRPAPEDDPDNHRIKVRNLARIWSVYRQAGARCLVATGDVSAPDIVDAYEAAVPELSMSVCRLVATRTPCGSGCSLVVAEKDRQSLETSCAGKLSQA